MEVGTAGVLWLITTFLLSADSSLWLRQPPASSCSTSLPPLPPVHLLLLQLLGRVCVWPCNKGPWLLLRTLTPPKVRGERNDGGVQSILMASRLFLPFLTLYPSSLPGCPVDIKFQGQGQRQEPSRDSFTSSHNWERLHPCNKSCECVCVYQLFCFADAELGLRVIPDEQTLKNESGIFWNWFSDLIKVINDPVSSGKGSTDGPEHEVAKQLLRALPVASSIRFSRRQGSG